MTNGGNHCQYGGGGGKHEIFPLYIKIADSHYNALTAFRHTSQTSRQGIKQMIPIMDSSLWSNLRWPSLQILILLSLVVIAFAVLAFYCGRKTESRRRLRRRIGQDAVDQAQVSCEISKYTRAWCCKCGWILTLYSLSSSSPSIHYYHRETVSQSRAADGTFNICAIHLQPYLGQ